MPHVPVGVHPSSRAAQCMRHCMHRAITCGQCSLLSFSSLPRVGSLGWDHVPLCIGTPPYSRFIDVNVHDITSLTPNYIMTHHAIKRNRPNSSMISMGYGRRVNRAYQTTHQNRDDSRCCCVATTFCIEICPSTDVRRKSFPECIRVFTYTRCVCVARVARHTYGTRGD